MSNIEKKVYAVIAAMRKSKILPQEWETEDMQCEPLLAIAMDLHLRLDVMDRTPEQDQAFHDLEAAIWR